MFYFRFVTWLFAKSDRWATKKVWGDVGVYNHFEQFDPTNGLLQLGRLVIGMIFYGLPLVGIVYGVFTLPLSPGKQALVLFLTLLSIYITAAVILIRKATKKGVTKRPL